ncbi:MAG: hypothetical protein AAF074_02060 [Pseudomonadota bacterium]
MSALRPLALNPEATAFLRRWWETAAALAVLGLGALRLFGWLTDGHAVEGVAGAVLVLGGALWLRTALTRALLAGSRRAPGIAAVREGEIAYFGPETGGVMAIDALLRVEVVARPALHGPVWRLTGEDGTVLHIPAGAQGAGAVLDALLGLPGFRYAEALQTGRGRGSGTVLVWERAAGPRIDRL